MNEERIAQIESRLHDALQPSSLEIEDQSHLHAGHAGARSGGGHFRATIVSEQFDGLSTVAAQRLVYGVLDGEMGTEIHALSMKTLTPAQWAEVAHVEET
jgi:BolA protein